MVEEVVLPCDKVKIISFYTRVTPLNAFMAMALEEGGVEFDNFFIDLKINLTYLPTNFQFSFLRFFSFSSEASL